MRRATSRYLASGIERRYWLIGEKIRPRTCPKQGIPADTSVYSAKVANRSTIPLLQQEVTPQGSNTTMDFLLTPYIRLRRREITLLQSSFISTSPAKCLRCRPTWPRYRMPTSSLLLPLCSSSCTQLSSISKTPNVSQQTLLICMSDRTRSSQIPQPELLLWHFVLTIHRPSTRWLSIQIPSETPQETSRYSNWSELPFVRRSSSDQRHLRPQHQMHQGWSLRRHNGLSFPPRRCHR